MLFFFLYIDCIYIVSYEIIKCKGNLFNCFLILSLLYFRKTGIISLFSIAEVMGITAVPYNLSTWKFLVQSGGLFSMRKR